MKVLVACEMSGVVRDAFIARGHEAISCDLLPSERPGPHFQGDVRKLIGEPWDMCIAFPPCTHLCVSGARWFKRKQNEQREALEFAKIFFFASWIPKRCIENPVGILSTKVAPPTQIIQPWQFGHGETKATCLWLAGLPKLVAADIVAGREARIHRMAPSENRGQERSKTYSGIAKAMAEQWG
jgi:hypothetical protein